MALLPRHRASACDRTASAAAGHGRDRRTDDAAGCRSDCLNNFLGIGPLTHEHGNDREHTVSRYILEKTPLTLMVYDPRSSRLETVKELSILDRIKVSSHVGYNVFGTASPFWQNRINALNANAARRMQ